MRKKAFRHKYSSCNIYSSSDCRRTRHSLLDSSWWDASNDCIFMSLASIDNELYLNVSKQKNANIFLSIEARDMKIPPFDMSCIDELNKLCFIFLWTIVIETRWYFWHVIIHKIEKKKHFGINIQTAISTYPVIVEEWDITCWIRHNEMHLMMVFICL